MKRRMRMVLAAAALLLGLLMPRAAVAAPGYDGCPGPCYSCKHYWAPQLWRVHSCLFCPKMNIYAPDRHPDIQPTFKAMRYKCPPVDPQQSSVDFYYTR
jgi:hypothetical protein